MSTSIKGFNYPWIKIQTGYRKDSQEPTYTYINIEKVETIDFDSVWYNSGTRDSLGNKIVMEIGDFLMSYKRCKVDCNIPGGVVSDTYVELMSEKQTLQEWLEENGQA